MIEDEDSYTPLFIKLIRLWQVRVILYTVVFVVVAVFLYWQLFLHPLETIRQLNVPENSFMWTTFRKGIAVGYLCSYLPLAVFYFLEFASYEVYTVDIYYEMESIQASRRVRRGILLAAVIITCSIPIVILSNPLPV